mgnify:CR=1 FL=1
MPGSETPTGNEEIIAQLSEVQARYEAELMEKPHVIGVAIGVKQTDGQPTDELAIIVMVDEKVPHAQLSEDEIIPQEIEGFPVDVQKTGFFYAQ